MSSPRPKAFARLPLTLIEINDFFLSFPLILNFIHSAVGWARSEKNMLKSIARRKWMVKLMKISFQSNNFTLQLAPMSFSMFSNAFQELKIVQNFVPVPSLIDDWLHCLAANGANVYMLVMSGRCSRQNGKKRRHEFIFHYSKFA